MPGHALTEEPAPTCTVQRPAVLFNRWQEDWSVLANPCVPAKPLDGLKYMPLGGDPDSYLSSGANLRERVEVNDAPLFGIGAGHSDTYLIQRAHVSARCAYRAAFPVLCPTRGRKSVRQEHRRRQARQEPARSRAGLRRRGQSTGWRNREVSHRPPGDGVRLAAVHLRPRRPERAADLRTPSGLTMSTTSGASSATPRSRCRTATLSAFDDVSNPHLTFSGVRFEHQDTGPGDLSGYHSRQQQPKQCAVSRPNRR